MTRGIPVLRWVALLAVALIGLAIAVGRASPGRATPTPSTSPGGRPRDAEDDARGVLMEPGRVDVRLRVMERLIFELRQEVDELKSHRKGASDVGDDEQR